MTDAPTQQAQRGSTVLLYLVVAMGVFVYYRSAWPSLEALAGSVDHGYILFADFVAHYAPTGRNLMQTKQASQGLHYSAFFALCMWFLMQLKWAAAVWVWSFLQLGAMGLLFALTRRRLCGGSAVVGATYLLVLLTSFPTLHNFAWGQVSIFTTLCLFGSLHLQERGKSTWAALVLSLGITVKYYPVILLAYFAMRRDVRTVALTALFSAVLLIVIPAGFLGLENTLRFYGVWKDLAGASDAIANDPNSQYFAHVMTRLGGFGSWTRWVGYLVVVANLGLMYSVCRRRVDDVAYASLGALVTSIPFVLPTSWPHYFIFLPPLQLFLVRCAVRQCAGTRRLVVSILVVVSVVLASVFLFRVVDDRVVYGADGYVFWANTALLAGLYAVFMAPRAAPAAA